MQMVNEMVLEYKVADVLKKLEENREEHKKIYDESVEGFWKDVVVKAQAFTNNLKEKKARGGTVSFSARVPEHHLDEYDTVITMLSMTKATEIALSMSQVNMYIRDQWRFQRDFLMSNSSFAGSARSKMSSMGYDS